MEIHGMTWQGANIDDAEILDELPSTLAQLLSQVNGFILHGGALHVRGASVSPEWHSLRAAWQGEHAFHCVYEAVIPTDIPFAEDQFGDQFLWRDGAVLRLLAETGEVEDLSESLEHFFERMSGEIEEFLNVGLNQPMQPGQLLLAYPPFCFAEAGAPSHIAPVLADEVHRFHGDLAAQIRDLPEGGQIRFVVTD